MLWAALGARPFFFALSAPSAGYIALPHRPGEGRGASAGWRRRRGGARHGLLFLLFLDVHHGLLFLFFLLLEGLPPDFKETAVLGDPSEPGKHRVVLERLREAQLCGVRVLQESNGNPALPRHALFEVSACLLPGYAVRAAAAAPPHSPRLVAEMLV